MATENLDQMTISKYLANRLRIEGALMVGTSITKISQVLNVSKKTVRGVKRNGALYRKKRIDNGRTKISPKIGKQLEKKIRGKKGIGIKKLSKSYKFSGTTIRRYLKKQSWGKYRVDQSENQDCQPKIFLIGKNCMEKL